MKNKIELAVGENYSDEPINIYELSRFLYLFRSVYVLMLETGMYKIDSREALREELLHYARALTSQGVVAKAGKILPPELELEFSDISRNSPLKFIGYSTGVAVLALSAAVILSGGTADLREGKFTLPPLAHGIRELNDALGKSQPRVLPSEQRTKTNATKKPKK